MERLYLYQGSGIESPQRVMKPFCLSSVLRLFRVTFFLFTCLFIAMMKPDIAMSGISGTVDLTYQKTKSVEDGVVTETETSGLSQGYTINLNRKLTSTIRLSGGVRMTITDNDGEKEKSYFPHIFLNYTSPFPEYFNLSMGYNRSESRSQDSPDLATDTFNTTLSIPTIKTWLPSLSISYNQAETVDDLSPHNVDTITKNLGVSSRYNLRFRDTPISLFYSYNNSKSEDNIRESSSENRNHQSTININRSFWNNRISAGGNFGFSKSENIGTEEEKITFGGLYSDSPADPKNVSMASKPTLIDDNTATSTGIDLTNSDQNIGLDLGVSQKVHTIYIYTDKAPTSPSTWTWTLYTSSDNNTWTSKGSPTVGPGIGFKGFIFTFTAVETRYFKVVNTSIAASTLNVTEIKAFGNISETNTKVSKSVSKRDFGGFNASFRATDKIGLSYSFNYSHSDSESADILSTGHTAGLSYIIFPKYLTMTTNYSTQMSKPSSGDKSGSNTYSLSLTNTPLPTVKANLSTGYSESISGGEVQSTSKHITTGISMELYKGIDLRLGAGLSNSENKMDASTRDSSSISGNLKLIPWRPIQITLKSSYSSSSEEKSEGKTKSNSNSLRTDIHYNPTRNIYITTYFSIKPTSSQSYYISWRPTQKVQASLSYNISQSDTKFSGSINWRPVTRFTLRTSYSLSKEDTGDYDRSFLLAVSIRL